MANFAFTFVRYKILAMVILSFVFLIIAFSRQDWMREELSMKMGPIKKLINANSESIFNMTSKHLDAKGKADAVMSMVPDDATIYLMAHFGLKKSCIKITAKKFGNPIQLAVPVISWCFNNDLFTEPQKYELPESANKVFSYITDEIQGKILISTSKSSFFCYLSIIMLV